MEAEEIEPIADSFKALGHPHRLSLMKRLLDRAVACSETDRPNSCEMDPSCCGFGELAAKLDIGKPTVSHHLKELRQAGLIERSKEGRRVYVRVRQDRVDELQHFLSGGTQH